MNAPTPQPPNWWTTVPGLLTGFAAIVTAVGSIIAVLVQGGFIGSRASAPAPAAPLSVAAAPAAAPVQAGRVAAEPAAAAPSGSTAPLKAMRITAKNGSVVDLKVTPDVQTGYLTLADGREVLYERIERVDIAQPWEGRLKILLVGGAVLEAESHNMPLGGVTDLGRYVAMLADMRRIEFGR